MSTNHKALPGLPFDIMEFNLTPHEVDKHFDVEADFQREIRRSTPMIRGIQATLLATHTLPRPLDICKGEDGRHIVIDGKHRLFALQTLEQNIRCTIYALCFRVSTHEEIVALFESFNLTVPPNVAHFLRLEVDRDNAILRLMRERLPFNLSVDRRTSHRAGGLMLCRVLHWLARAFSDVPSFSRFTKNEVLQAITPAHVELLAAFARIFEISKPVKAIEQRTLHGWFDLLFRIFVQNHGVLTEAEWARRIRNVFVDRRTRRCLDDPVVTMQTSALRNLVIAALNEPHSPRIAYSVTKVPTIRDIKVILREAS